MHCRRTTRAVVPLLLLLVPLAGCAGSAAGSPDYGPEAAGPTAGASAGAPVQTSSPRVSVAGPAPEIKGPLRDAALCAAYSQRRIAWVLGLAVDPVVVWRSGSAVVCTWRARDDAVVPSWRVGDPVLAHDDGVVVIRRAPAGDRDRLETRITGVAKRAYAYSRSTVPEVGLRAFAIGGSVSGVPMWQALAVHADVVTAVEVSGADSRSSVAVIKSFLAEVVAGP